MNKEPIESYKLGEKKEKISRGNTAGGTKKTMEDEDKDNQEEHTLPDGFDVTPPHSPDKPDF
jgi:hypothetical protein